jgi:hypothetical protein
MCLHAGVCVDSYHYQVYGESTGWDMCTDFFEDVIEKRRVPLGDLVKAVDLANPYKRDLGHAANLKRCHRCGTSAVQAPTGLKFCARCKTVRYCSRLCQTADWQEGHKRTCIPAAAPAPAPAPTPAPAGCAHPTHTPAVAVAPAAAAAPASSDISDLD